MFYYPAVLAKNNVFPVQLECSLKREKIVPDTNVRLPLFGSNSFSRTIDATTVARITWFYDENIGWTVDTTDGIHIRTTVEGYGDLTQKLDRLRRSGDPNFLDLVLTQVTTELTPEGLAPIPVFVCVKAVRNIRSIGNGQSRVTIQGLGEMDISDYAASQLR